jgi:uroporphyrinogen-III synthase
MLILLTRPLEESRALAETLEAEGIECLIWPLTRIEPVAQDLKLPPTVQGLLFTSANGVRALAALTPRRDLPALCVGGATARAARKAGFLNCFSAEGDARALADLARRSGLADFFHPRGRDAAGDLKGWLAETGQRVTEAVLYEARETGAAPAPVASALARGKVDLVAVWSRRNAEILARHLAGRAGALGAATLLAISPAAAEPLAGAGFGRVTVAESPDGAAMLAAIRAANAAMRR